MYQKLRRSLLYVSASTPKNFIISQFYGADCILIDLEDSVQRSEKDAARNLVFNFLKNKRITNTEIIVRVNDINTKDGIEDLKAIVLAKPDLIRFPKIENKDDVLKADELISNLEDKYNIEKNSTKIIVGVENYKGVSNAKDIALASRRIEAISIGGEDYVTSMGGIRSREGQELFYARNEILIAAKIAGIQAFDTIYSNFNDEEGLYEETKLIKNMGFDGKYLIHPNQVEIVNEVFTPSDIEIEKAFKILEIIKIAQENKKGAIKLENEMVDEPIVKRAQTILLRAKMAGKIKGGINFGY